MGCNERCKETELQAYIFFDLKQNLAALYHNIKTTVCAEGPTKRHRQTPRRLTLAHTEIHNCEV